MAVRVRLEMEMGIRRVSRATYQRDLLTGGNGVTYVDERRVPREMVIKRLKAVGVRDFDDVGLLIAAEVAVARTTIVVAVFDERDGASGGGEYRHAALHGSEIRQRHVDSRVAVV